MPNPAIEARRTSYFGEKGDWLSNSQYNPKVLTASMNFSKSTGLTI
jgi:hypothetical protein